MNEEIRQQVEEVLMRYRLEWIQMGCPNQLEKLESRILSEIKDQKEKQKDLIKFNDWAESLIQDGIDYVLVETLVPRRTVSVLKVTSSFLTDTNYRFSRMSISRYPIFEKIN